jgi:hypothetical protein
MRAEDEKCVQNFNKRMCRDETTFKTDFNKTGID